MRTTVRAVTDTARHARLSARPEIAAKGLLPPGLHNIGVPGSREALLYVPAGVDPDGAALVVSLHGAGGYAGHGIELLQLQADERHFAILAPASRERTWDVIVGRYGPDVMALDFALSYTFEHIAVRPDAIAISGFSDGASYALSVGLVNGHLFHEVIAFSPGFAVPGDWQGRPRIFISHGIHDTVLPVARCSRVIVPRLRAAGYGVVYEEFQGAHTVPENMKAAAVDHWLEGQAQP